MSNKALVKLVSLTLACCVIYSTTVFASETTTTITESSTDKTASVPITASIGETYTVKLPTGITLGTDKKASYSVSAEGDILTSHELNVVPTKNVDMSSDTSSVTKSAIVAQDKETFSSTELIADGGATTTGSVDATSITSGAWSGYCTFTISLTDVQVSMIKADDAIKVDAIEDVWNDKFVS